jgi:hypothetical protein
MENIASLCSKRMLQLRARGDGHFPTMCSFTSRVLMDVWQEPKSVWNPTSFLNKEAARNVPKEVSGCSMVYVDLRPPSQNEGHTFCILITNSMFQVLQSNNNPEIELDPFKFGWQGVTLEDNIKNNSLPPSLSIDQFSTWWSKLLDAFDQEQKEQRAIFSELLHLSIYGISSSHSAFHVSNKE